MVFEIGHASEINGVHDCWNLWPSEKTIDSGYLQRFIEDDGESTTALEVKKKSTAFIGLWASVNLKFAAALPSQSHFIAPVFYFQLQSVRRCLSHVVEPSSANTGGQLFLPCFDPRQVMFFGHLHTAMSQ